ncbi:hypothetical protein C0992_008116, partial [Termitomyces sp. T32_za158]
MADEENCALNADGTLKDASEITFFHSPSDKRPISAPNTLKNHEDSDVDDLPTVASISRGLKAKKPAQLVGGKRVPKPSAKVRAGEQSLQSFFTKTTTRTQGSNQAYNLTLATISALPILSKATGPSRKRGLSETNIVNNNKRVRVTQSSANDEASDVNLEEGRDDDEGSQDEDQEVVYEHLQKMSEADHLLATRKHAIRGNDTRTDDIRTCFTPATCEVDGVERRGHYCNICKDHLKIRASDCFFRGNGSTLRTHIKRAWSSHGSIYRRKCEMKGITPHSRACPEVEHHSHQETLNDYVKSMPKWTVEGLRGMIVNLVVDNFSAIRLVDKASFRDLLIYQRPSTKESEIPHRTTISDEIMYKANIVQDRLKAKYM